MIELVIVLTIIPIVIAGISAAIITSFKDQVGISNRLSDSYDAQLTAAYFVPDVESATYVTTSVSPVPCYNNLGADTLVVEMTEMAGSQASQVYYVYNTLNYTTNSEQDALLRIVCTGSGYSSPGGITIVAHSVTSANVTILCDNPVPAQPPSQTTWSGPDPWYCNQTGAPVQGQKIGGYAPTIESVAITVSEVPTNSGNTQLDSYTYTQSATPREWVPDTSAVSGGGELPGLLVLGPNMKTGANLIQFLSMSATLTTQGSTDSGAIDVDSSSAGSVSMIGSDTISGSGGLNIYNCASSGGTCTNSVTSIGNNQTTRPVPVSTAVPDPLLTTLTAPPSPASPGSCTGPNGSLTSSITANDTPITCTAGLYSSGLNISGTGDTITFTNQGVSNAVFQFGKACKNSKCATTGLTVAGPQDTLNFQNGTYLFEGATSDAGTCTTAGSLSDLNQGGISISGGGDILQDKGAGVFFYVAGGPADFGCVASENTIDLSPMTSGTYQGVLLFVNRATSTPVVLDGFSTSGTIYAPDSAVESFGTSTNTTGSLIVQYLVVNENVTIA